MPYRDLVARMDALALTLRARGIGPGARVGIHLQRSSELIVAMLGILAAGAAYVPLDPDYPPSRLRDIIEDSQISLLLGEADAEELCAGIPGGRLDPSDWADRLPGGPLPALNPRDPAHLIYTSGSTGVPKGVVVEHAALCNYLAWCLSTLPATGGGAPLVVSASVDHSVTSIYPPLLFGEALTLLPPLQAGRALAKGLLTGHHYSYVKVTPSHLRLLTPDQRAELGCSADLVILGGERFDSDLVTQLRRDSPHLAVMNHYGPTEATVGCCAYFVPTELSKGPIPIGRPLHGAHAIVRDPSGAVCCANEPGELYIGGECLARGYWRRPDLTAAAFVILPDPEGVPKRWYRTGDLVRPRANGLLEYLGRMDGQVKIMGHRVEPAEIEAVLRSHAGVGDAAVLAAQLPLGVELVAAVVAKTTELTEALLRQHARARLPGPMIPTRFIFVDRLPVNASGKLDRESILRKANATPQNAATGFIRPRTSDDVDSKMAAKWQELLGIESIHPGDDFFELGGDSLASIEIITWISEEFRVELELAALFEHPTIRDIAAVIRERQNLPVDTAWGNGRLIDPQL